MLKKVLLILFIFLLVPPHLVADDNIDYSEGIDISPEQSLDSKDFLRDTFILYTGLWVGRMFYVRNKNSRIFDTSFEKWWDNISQFPVVNDDDAFFTNYIVHPYIGSLYYLYYREMEHDFWPSALGSLVQSTLFEYTIEGLVETPSLPDLIATPGLGVPLGYILETSSDWFQTKDNEFSQVFAKLLNPMKMIINERKVVLFNPITGSFEYKTDFNSDTPERKRVSLNLSYPVFFESAVPRGFLQGQLEFIDLQNDLTGKMILYHIKAEFPDDEYERSMYLRLSQGGVDDTEDNGEDVRDGFEFANTVVGYKKQIYNDSNSVLTAGFETILPTAYKDNIDRLEFLLNHKRDFPIYLIGSFTFTPYLSFAFWKGLANIQGSVGTDLIVLTDKDELEGDNVEWRVKYSLSAGTGFNLPMSPLLFVEFNGYSHLTAEKSDITDLFLGSGIRFGNRVSPGFMIQFPVDGMSSEISSASYVFDLRMYY